MKKLAVVLVLLGLFVACSKDSQPNGNPYLPNYSFSVSINRNLPLYSGLNSPINPVFIDIEGAGISGIIAMKISDNDFRAWEACCPNQYPTACSRMSIANNTTAKCSCENYNYNLLTGIGDGAYTLKPYHVEVQGDVLRIYN